MYTRLLISVFLCFVFTKTIAQVDKKPVIAILSFSHEKGNALMEQYANTLQEKVVEGFVKSKRFELVERSRLDELSKEMKIQEVMADTQIASIGKTLGCQFVVFGNMNNLSAGKVQGSSSLQGGKNSLTYTNSDVGYTGQVAMNIKIVEVATSKIFKSESIQAKSGGAGQVMGSLGALGSLGRMAQAGAKAGMPKSEAEAVSKAIEKLDEEIGKFIDRNFPLYVEILEATNSKKGDAIEGMEIAVGSEMGFEKGDVLKVVKVNEREVLGRKTTSLDYLGVIKITVVTGELTSKGQITKGGPEIKAAYDADKTKIKVLFDGTKK